MFCACFGRKRKPSDSVKRKNKPNICNGERQPVSSQVEDKEKLALPLENHVSETPSANIQTPNRRKLPDIPHNEDSGSQSHLENHYNQSSSPTLSHSHNANEEPNSTPNPDLHFYESEIGASTSQPKLDPVKCKSEDGAEPFYPANHRYAVVLRQTSDENYDMPQLYSTPMHTEKHPQDPKAIWASSDKPAYETLPPVVPIKNFDQDEPAGPSSEASTSGATATADRYYQQIPYMTSPDRNSLEDLQFENTDNDSGGKQMTKYSSISVREPIKEVMEKLAKQQAPKQRVRQVTEESEAVYMTVQDVDETYEEIEGRPSSDLTDSNYTQITNPVLVEGTGEPPEPPTVESLMNVAQAHSRNASCSSMKNLSHTQPLTVDITDPGSDYVGSRDLLHDPKKARQTVHIMESEDPSRPHVEAMYAKVQKKKGSSSSGHSPAGRASLVIIQTQPLPQEPFEPSTTRVLFRRESSTVDPGYEKISGGRNTARSGSDPGTFTGARDTDSVAAREDPGYARVVDTDSEALDPTYESVAARTPSLGSSDPGYWKIRSPEEDIGDHLYELINSRKKDGEEEEEPDYDRVRYAAANDTDEEEEPAYEKVKPKGHSPETQPQNCTDKVPSEEEETDANM